MKKSLRFMAAVVAIIIVIVILLNLPVLGRGMIKTIISVPLDDWLKYIVGAIIGAVSMWFANKKGSKE